MALVLFVYYSSINVYTAYKTIFSLTGFKELPANGALLMYISADGCCPQSKSGNDCKHTYFHIMFEKCILLFLVLFSEITVILLGRAGNQFNLKFIIYNGGAI